MHKCEFAAEMRACGIPSVEMTAQYTRVREIARYGVKMRVRCDALLTFRSKGARGPRVPPFCVLGLHC